MALDMKDHMTLESDPLIAHSHPHFCAVSRCNALLILCHLNTSEVARRERRVLTSRSRCLPLLRGMDGGFTESRRLESHHVE